MLQKKITFILLYVIPFSNFAQETTDSVQITKLLNEVKVNALRAGEKTPVAFTNISKSEIVFFLIKNSSVDTSF